MLMLISVLLIKLRIIFCDSNYQRHYFPSNLWRTSLRKQPSFFGPGTTGVSQEGRPSRETPLGPEAKKDGCFRWLVTH